TGRFGETCDGGVADTTAPSAGLLRLDGGRWVPSSHGDAADDYIRRPATTDANTAPTQPFIVQASGSSGASQGWTIIPQSGTDVPAEGFGRQPFPYGPALALGQDGDWNPMATPFALVRGRGTETREGVVRAVAPDGADGSWWAVRRTFTVTQVGGQPSTWFYHYTRHVPRPVFTDVPLPIDTQTRTAEPLTALTGAGDGRIWLATAAGVVYRYDRAVGWDRLVIPGWDPGRVVTRTSEGWALAANDSGIGVLVGHAGRIADLSPAGVALDPAAGLTGRELRAAAVAPDGSALIGGEHAVLMYRPAGGTFARITPPNDLFPTAEVTGISMPVPDRAWLVADSGQLFEG